jgi:hypothetical protein
MVSEKDLRYNPELINYRKDMVWGFLERKLKVEYLMSFAATRKII